MKVLFIQKEGGIFGAEQYHLNTIPALLKAGVSVSFLRLYTDYQLGIDSEFVHRLRAFQIPVFQVNIGRLPGFTDIRKVAQIIREGRYDIVHSHLIHGDLYAAVCKIFYSIPSRFVSTKHGYDNKYAARYGFNPDHVRNTPYYWLLRWAESRMHKSFTISRGLRDFFIKSGVTTGQKMDLIYYGFDLPSLEATSNGASFRKGYPQLCIAGRLVEFKGHRWAFEALALLLPSFPEMKLVVAGIGPAENDLKAYVQSLGIAHAVVWLGYNKEVSRWMKESDVVLIPSRSEGFGVVFLEAFNAETPVVAFDVPAANELIIHGKTGLLAQPYQASSLADGVTWIMNHPEECKTITANAKEKLLSYFSLDRMVTETVAWYKKVLA